MSVLDHCVERFRQVSVAVLLLLSLAKDLPGQGASASITGSLKDSSGAVGPSSAVVAQSVESGRQYSTLTNSAGIYTLAAIPPGHYTLTVERSGFKRLANTRVELWGYQIA